MKFRFLFSVILIFVSGAIIAQSRSDTYLEKARNALNRGDCDAAQIYYDNYKISGKTDAQLEAGIKKCKDDRKTKTAQLQNPKSLTSKPSAANQTGETTGQSGANQTGKTNTSEQSGAKQQEPNTVTALLTTGTLNGHEWVDLGLPSGTKWATCNVGASNPREYGSYFAWGETSPKSSYTEDNYMYFSEPNVLPESADAATVNWGEGWRMPTTEEFLELRDKCTWTRITNGYKVIGPNGNGIFLPAAGYRYDSEFSDAGSLGYYWLSSLSGTDFAWYLFFNSADYDVYNGYRDDGLSVRPVCQCVHNNSSVPSDPKQLETNNGTVSTITSTLNDHQYVDLGLPSGTLWATCNVGASNPREYGSYFAWGETVPNSSYTDDNYMYFSDPNVLPASADAATVNWGKGWRMPTEEDFQELIDNCTWTWMSNGYKVTSPNGNGIFLPAAGNRYAGDLRDVGSIGYYWSSSLYSGDSYHAWFLYFNPDNYSIYDNYRYGGLSIRAVCNINNK